MDKIYTVISQRITSDDEGWHTWVDEYIISYHKTQKGAEIEISIQLFKYKKDHFYFKGKKYMRFKIGTIDIKD